MDLIASRMKVDNAKRHIVQLERMLSTFTRSNPLQLVGEYKLGQPVDSNAGILPAKMEWHYKINARKPFPREICLIFGDVVHNLRAAIDYPIHLLVKENGGNPKYTGFPFEETSQGYDAVLANQAGKVGVIPQPYKDMIRRIEGYKGGKGDLLWHMNKLDVIDKHRILLASEFITGLKCSGPVPGLLNFTGSLRNRNPDGYLFVGPQKILPNRYTTLTFDVVIAEDDHLKDRKLVETLHEMTNHTAEVLNEFESVALGLP